MFLIRNIYFTETIPFIYWPCFLIITMADIQMLLKVDKDLHALIKAEAEQQERSFAGQVRFILNSFFKEEKEE